MLLEVQNGYVKTETHNYVTTIEFFHPKGNSLPGKILEELAKEIHFAGTHSETRVIILKSAGDRIFCSGASFDELIHIKTLEEGIKFFSGFAQIINAVRKCPKFVIGRVQGRSVGGGIGLIAAVDYAIYNCFAGCVLSLLPCVIFLYSSLSFAITTCSTPPILFIPK